MTAILIVIGIPAAVILFLWWGGKQPWWPQDGGP